MFIDKEPIHIHKFTGSAILRYQNNIYHESIINHHRTFVLFQKSEYLNYFIGIYNPFEFLRIGFFSIDWSVIGDVKNIKDFFHDKNHLINKIYNIFIDIDLHSKLLSILKEMNIYLYYSILEITKSDQENQLTKENVYQLSSYYSAGYPPLIKIENNSYHFPVRSGIPMGINNIIPPKQVLEIPLKSRIYIHTPLNEKKHNIRELHYDILKYNLDIIPEDILLFEYQLSSYDF